MPFRFFTRHMPRCAASFTAGACFAALVCLCPDAVLSVSGLFIIILIMVALIGLLHLPIYRRAYR